MNKIPLTIRLLRLEDGEPSDGAYNTTLVKELADMPIATYLGGFGDELERLIRILGLLPAWAKDMRYRDIAVIIARSHDCNVRFEALTILALPFKRCYKERAKKHGKIIT